MPTAAPMHRPVPKAVAQARRREASRTYDRRRYGREDRAFYGSQAWRKAAKAQLGKEPRCEDCLRYDILTPATEADHIDPIRQGGDQWGDLQSLCKTCHNRKTSREAKMPVAARVHSVAPVQGTRITLIGGPPAAGKTTWLREHAAPGDLIVDFDAIYVALSGRGVKDKPLALLPFVCAARDAVIERLLRDSEVRAAWVITGGADRIEFAKLKQKLRANSMMLVPSAEECKRRVASDPERQGDDTDWGALIDQWWDNCGADPSAW